jgi:beta-lactamase class A
MSWRSILVLFAACAVWACKSPQKQSKAPDPLSGSQPAPISPVPQTSSISTEKQPVMEEKPDYGVLAGILDVENSPFASVFGHPDSFNLQIIYTQIDRDRSNRPVFTDHVFQLKPGRYFYPASTVKMPIAILALQKLRELNLAGLDRNSAMITETDFPGQTPVFNDPTTPDGRPSIDQYIRKIFLVSDNDAYNRLYEFLGPQYINRTLHQMGYTEAEIIHRLELSLTEEQNRHTNPVRFLDKSGNVVYAQPGQYHEAPYSMRNEKIGRAYMKGGQKMDGPLDFSGKNRISLRSLHEILKAVIFPDAVPVKQRFFLGPEDYAFIRKYMSMTPASAGYPPYDSTIYFDTYCKFLLFGAEKHQKIPAGMKVFNKVGDAYGHLLDLAYVADAVNGVEFMLSAVIYCNQDGVLNDDNYDYEEIGLPFMKYIGQRIYFHEKARRKNFKPDLTWTRQQD